MCGHKKSAGLTCKDWRIFHILQLPLSFTNLINFPYIENFVKPPCILNEIFVLSGQILKLLVVLLGPRLPPLLIKILDPGNEGPKYGHN